MKQTTMAQTITWYIPNNENDINSYTNCTEKNQNVTSSTAKK